MKWNKWVLTGTLAYITARIMNRMLTRERLIKPNPTTLFNLTPDKPKVDPTAYLHPAASIIGQATIGKNAFIGPFASIRADEGLRIHIGNDCNVQDGVVMHGLKNFEAGKNIEQNTIFVNEQPFSIHIGDRVSLTHQCQVHGPCLIESDVFIGMQCFVFDSHIESGAILEPCSKAIGVTIPSHRYVPAGQTVTTQQQADELPEITSDYKYSDFNSRIIAVNQELTRGYERSEEQMLN